MDRKEFEKRTFPHAYDVLIYQDGGHYYAKDRNGNVICVDSPTACLQESIDHIAQLGGGRIFIKSGTYKVNSYVNILANNIEISGEGMGITVIKNYATYVPAIYIGNDNQTSIIVRNIYIHDLTIDAMYQYSPSNPQGNGNSTLWAYYVSDLTLERIEHKNAYWRTSITLGSTGCNGQCIQENIIIRNNIFRGVALTLGGIQNLIFEDNIFYGTAVSPAYNTILDFSFGEYQDTYIYNAVVKGNIFYKVYRNPNNTAGWIGAVSGFQRVVGAIWEGNTFIDPDNATIYILSTTASGTTLDLRGVEFIGNTIIGLGKTANGIVVKHGKIVIKGNYIENTTDIAIDVSGAEVVIEGNYVVNTPSAAIWVSSARASIIGNILNNCAQSRHHCIILDGTSAYCAIIGNRLYRSTADYLPNAINTSYSQGYNTVIGNTAEGQWNSTKYATTTTDVAQANI